MKIDDEEFENILWQVKKLDLGVDLREKYHREFVDIFPHLAKGRVDGIEANRLVRYVIFMYDKESPLRKHIKNIDERKDYAAKLSGYSRSNIDPKKKKRVITEKDIQVVETIVALIKYVDDKSYAQMVILENMFWAYHKRLMSKLPDDIDKNEMELRSKLRNELKSIQDDIQSIEHTLYGGDKEVLEAIKEVKKIRTFPEGVAV